MIVVTTKHSTESAKALGEALGCPVINVSEHRFPETYNETYIYNMGFSGIEDVLVRQHGKVILNEGSNVGVCVNKVRTFRLLESNGVLVVPWTDNKEIAQQWLNEDRIIVNRKRLEGKSLEGMSFSFKGLWGREDTPLDLEAKIWTRYVNHTRELRAYVFRGFRPLVFEKRRNGELWDFTLVKTPDKLREQLARAEEINDGLIFSAYDILECVTGDYYFLENNSAPSLLVHPAILPKLVKTIQHHTKPY